MRSATKGYGTNVSFVSKLSSGCILIFLRKSSKAGLINISLAARAFCFLNATVLVFEFPVPNLTETIQNECLKLYT